jgi:TolA-binding protein
MSLKNQRYYLLSIACVAGLSMYAPAHAQVHVSVAPANSHITLTDELFKQGHYGQSAQSAKAYQKESRVKIGSTNATDDEIAKFTKALARLKDNQRDAENYAINALEDLTNLAMVQRLSFGLAQYYFRQDNFVKAIAYYEAAGIYNLDNEEISDQKFELAYSYFNNKQFDKAKPLFSAIKDIKGSKYYVAGNYYYGLLCYNESKYSEALESFDLIKEENEYNTIVPYYIAEIYYFKGERIKALQLSEQLIKGKIKSYYQNELHLLAGQCHFEDQKYKEAKPHFEYYYKNVKKIGKENLYKIAYCYYRLNEWKNATEKFKMLSNSKDSLGQTSMYLLGDCYLKTGDKNSARNAFGLCADMNYNTSQQEAAMILYARLSYETGNKDEALRQLSVLINSFPQSAFRDEAKTLTSDLLIKTNNYSAALKQLSEVNVKDKEYWSVYQKATYGYGVQQFRKGELYSADENFEKSLSNPVNPEYEKAAYFWRGEIAYQQQRYTEAITFSQNFISRNGNTTVIEKMSPQATIQHAYLNMGHAAMETGNYVAAQDYFNQAQLARAGDRHTATVAAVLEADAVFLQKNYTKATILYDKIIASGGVDAEYARYQKGILLGLQNRGAEKIELLQSIANSSAPSIYSGGARYEIALTYLEQENFPLALKTFKQIADSGADANLAPKALMKMAFIHQQQNDISKAIDAYKRVVIYYPGSEERFAALESLKGLYIQNNQPGKYAELLRDNNLPSADSSSLDSTYYAAGEAQYAAGKWDNARQAFGEYVRFYPNGIFSTKANYYLGESNYKLRKYTEARTNFNKVLSTPWNDFSESSAKRNAMIAMELKDYEQAFVLYTTLRSNVTDNSSLEMVYRGLMKSCHYTTRHAECSFYADSLMAMNSLSVDVANEAKFYKARSLQIAGKSDEAITSFTELAGNKNGEIAAESRYRIAEILATQDKLKEAEAAASETIRLSAGYDTWVGKSYILLADILVKQNDYFNAKALLQSIVKNTKSSELKQEAAKKLEEVKSTEKRQSKLSEE